MCSRVSRSRGAGRPAGGDEHPAHTGLLEQLQVAAFAARVTSAVAEQHHPAGGVDLVLHTACDVGEEGVGGVDDDQADRAPAAGAQLAGGLVAHEAEPVDDLLHALEGLRRHRVRPVQHVGDGADGDPGRPGDLLDADPLAPRRAPSAWGPAHCAPETEPSPRPSLPALDARTGRHLLFRQALKRFNAPRPAAAPPPSPGGPRWPPPLLRVAASASPSASASVPRSPSPRAAVTTPVPAPARAATRCHAVLPRRQRRDDRPRPRRRRGVHGGEPRHHHRARDPAAGQRGRQHRQDPAGDRGHDRRLLVQLRVAAAGARARRRPWSPLSGEAWVGPSTTPSCRGSPPGDEVYGVPVGNAMGGGVLLQQDGLRASSASGPHDVGRVHGQQREDQGGRASPRSSRPTATPGPRSCSCSATSTTSQADEPDWADKYTANQAKFADDAGRARGLRAPAGGASRPATSTSDFASATYADGPARSPTGEGAHYPMLTFALTEIVSNIPDNADDIGFFAMPGDDAASNAGMTTWAPGGALHRRRPPRAPSSRRPRSSWPSWRQPGGLRRADRGRRADRPVLRRGLRRCRTTCRRRSRTCGLLRQRRRPARRWSSSRRSRARPWSRSPSRSAPASRSAADGAALYDEDVKKQAQQLGLEGW